MIRRLCALVTALLLAGCASTPISLPESRPADYSMVVTVFPVEADKTGQTGPSWLRPARYALGPDGHLRAETGLGVAKPGFPLIARLLEPAEFDRVYELARRADLTGGGATPVAGVDVYAPSGEDRVALIEIASKGRFIAAESPASEGSAIAPLIRELARLAWLDQ